MTERYSTEVEKIMERSPELQILDLLRMHLSASQFTATAYGTDVTTTQAAVLDELARDPQLQIDRIAKLLCVHQSTASRAISQLNTLGMVKSKVVKPGGRLLHHIVTAKGRKFAKFQWEFSERLYAQGLRCLTKEEGAGLQRFLTILLGYDPATTLSTLPEESWISFVFRGLTYEHGVLSDDYLQSGYSVRDWFVLSEIHYQGRTASSLASLMQISPSTVTVLLNRYTKKDFIQSKKDSLDKRVKEFSLTAFGCSVVTAIEDRATSIFHEKLSSLSLTELRSCIEIFKRYVEGMSGGNEQLLQWVDVQPEQLSKLRIVAQRYVASAGERYPHSGFFLHANNRILVDSRSKPRVLVELESTGSRREWNIVNVFPVGSELPSTSPSALISSLKHTLKGGISSGEEFSQFLKFILR